MNKIKKLFEQVDLTKGTIWKVIIWFSIPILISYLFQQIYSIADASICGKYLNVNQVAGVNNTSNIVFIVLQFAFGCTAGFSVVTSNKVGQKDKKILCNSNKTIIIYKRFINHYCLFDG